MILTYNHTNTLTEQMTIKESLIATVKNNLKKFFEENPGAETPNTHKRTLERLEKELMVRTVDFFGG